MKDMICSVNHETVVGVYCHRCVLCERSQMLVLNLFQPRNRLVPSGMRRSRSPSPVVLLQRSLSCVASHKKVPRPSVLIWVLYAQFCSWLSCLSWLELNDLMIFSKPPPPLPHLPHLDTSDIVSKPFLIPLPTCGTLCLSVSITALLSPIVHHSLPLLLLLRSLLGLWSSPLLIRFLHIEGFWPEWCLSTIYHAWDTPFWLGILDMLSFFWFIHRGNHIPSSWIVRAGCVLSPAFTCLGHECQNLFESVQWNTCVH